MSPPAILDAETLSNGKVTYAKDGPVTLVTLIDPPANGYSYEMMRDLDEAILRARFDDEVTAIVIAGEGEKFFCAGADIGMLNDVTPSFKYSFCLHANETLLRLEHTPKLVIAALGGHCVGGGLELALACDLRVARKGSGRCGLPEVSLGVLPGTGGTQRLGRLLGKAKAIEMMVTGDLIDYETAVGLGLITKTINAADEAAFVRQVLDYARSFAAPGKAGLAVGHIKRAVQTGVEIPLEAGLALERELQAKLFASEDAREGMAAFVEKREARFRGR